MMASRKAAKRYGESSPATSGGEDRLSALPDAVRLHILTLLPLKSAIRTGLLSSGWRDLWRHRWPHPSSIDLSPPPRSDLDAFSSSVDDILRRRGRRPLDSLSLYFRPEPKHLPAIARWLTYAASCSVSELRLDLHPSTYANSPSSSSSTSLLPGSGSLSTRRSRRRSNQNLIHFAFACESPSLVSLTLSGFRLASPARFKPLKNLEYLTFDSLRLSDAALRRIVAALPALRSLDIRRCPNLKRIVIPGPAHRLSGVTLVECPKAYEIVISAPNIKSFRIGGGFPAKHRFMGVWIPLDELYVCSGGTNVGLPRSDWVRAFGAGIVGHVRVLTLCNLALQYLANSPADVLGEFSNLMNLRELQLVMMVLADGDLMDIYGFFKKCHCPRLERLFIELPEHMDDPFLKKHLDVVETPPPEGGLEHLQVTKLLNFKGHFNEMRLLAFLLEKSWVLQLMVIISPRELLIEKFSYLVTEDHPDVLDVLGASLALLPKASASARIVLNERDDRSLRPLHELL